MFRDFAFGLMFIGTSFSAWAGNVDSLFAACLPQLVKAGENSRVLYSEEERTKAAGQFDSILHIMLDHREAMEYGFPGVGNMSSLRSDDGRIRLLTWMVPLAGGKYTHHGYVLVDDDGQYRAEKLVDRGANTLDPAYKTLKSQQWYGGLYYEIIEREFDGGNIYVLLGYRSVNPNIQQKFVDVLTIDEGRIEFGAQIFETPEFNDIHFQKRPHRITMSYGAGRSALLQWNEDYPGIVMDHVAPEDISQKGLYMLYGPDFSYDALVWKDEKWHLESNITFENDVETPPAGGAVERGLSPGGR